MELIVRERLRVEKRISLVRERVNCLVAGAASKTMVLMVLLDDNDSDYGASIVVILQLEIIFNRDPLVQTK